ncbi:MAG: hypothetical protein AAF530_05550 [Pseudomonadota bacterium]
MDQIEHPPLETWQARRDWFESLQQANEGQTPVSPSEQASALLIDLQAVFCAGAWVAAIVLAAAVIESQSRHVGGRPSSRLPGLSIEERRWLYHLRNRLVHEHHSDPVLTIEDQWLNRPDWERRARRAVEMAVRALYPPAAGT